MKTKEKVNVNSQDSITVKLEDSKGMVDRLIAFSSLILIPVVGLGLGIWMQHLTDEQTTNYNNKVLDLQTQVENTKQLNTYLDKVGEIISKNKTIEVIHNRPSFSFKLQYIKEMDLLTRSYMRNLDKDSRRIVLIYLYESDLINHTKATGSEDIGQEGICHNYKAKLKERKGNILIESNTVNRDEYSYCNLSTNRYYFDAVDMSGVFMKQIKLHNSYLNRTNFTNANLMGAEFIGSGFRGANFSNANLRSVDFSGANLLDAKFSDADIQKADFTGVEDIIPEQIKKAKNWKKATYDSDFRKQLGLPIE